MINILSYKKSLPTAFVADNDIIALGAMKALKENNIKIQMMFPLWVLMICLFAQLQIKPTTINVDKNALGRLAVENLIQLIESRKRIFTKLLLV